MSFFATITFWTIAVAFGCLFILLGKAFAVYEASTPQEFWHRLGRLMADVTITFIMIGVTGWFLPKGINAAVGPLLGLYCSWKLRQPRTA